MTVMIRLARDEDDAALADLDRRCWSVEHEVVPRREQGAPFFTNFRPDHALVAEVDGVLVGWIKVVKATPLVSNAHVAQVQGLAVDAAARRQGVGSRLVTAACELARERGARRIWLRVLATNPGAVKLYESVGFVVEGVLPEEFYLDGRYVDDIIMGRSLL